MANISTGTDAGTLKSVLRRASGEAPVRCGVATPKDGPFALLLVDKVKPAKTLSSELEKSFAGAKAARWGTVYPDSNRPEPAEGAPEERAPDAKLLVFTINKPAPGLAKRLVKTLKLNKTGFSKVELRFEDGSEPETVEEEDDEDEDAAAAEPKPQAAAADPAAQVATARRQLEGLIPRIAATAGADAARRAQLAKLAQEAGAAIKASDAAAAMRLAGQLEAALGSANGAGTANGAAASGIPAGVVAYGKARLTWLAVRKKMQTDLDALRKALLEHYQGDADLLPSVQQGYDTRVKPVLEAMDEALADRLDDAINATDPAERARLVGAAADAIRRYQAFIASDPTLAAMDGNPLVPMTLRQTLDTTLGALAKAVR